MPSAARRWLLVAVWIFVIYTTIPFVRSIREWYVARWNPIFIGWAVAAVLVITAGFVVVLLKRSGGKLRPGAQLWVAGIAAVMVAWTLSLRRSPEEAVHFLEYGALAVVIHRALRTSFRDGWVFVAGALIGSLVGTVDEIIQWFSPNRFWDWRDLVLNTGAGALVQLALWRMIPPPPPTSPTVTIRLSLRLAVAQLLVLTLCLANTPSLVARYAPHLPGCSHLMTTRNPMAEYGHFHVAPGLGSFKSRLELDELEREDRERAAEAAKVVDETRHTYGHFLDTWPVSTDPFTYEMRVHLFSRDRNLGKARELGFEGTMAARYLATSWSENRLLEGFFGTALGQSSYGWKPGHRQRIESTRDPDLVFHSAVGSHLITIASEGLIRALLLALTALLVATDTILARRRGGRS